MGLCHLIESACLIPVMTAVKVASLCHRRAICLVLAIWLILIIADLLLLILAAITFLPFTESSNCQETQGTGEYSAATEIDR